jgi:hypothetical protein
VGLLRPSLLLNEFKNTITGPIDKHASLILDANQNSIDNGWHAKKGKSVSRLRRVQTYPYDYPGGNLDLICKWHEDCFHSDRLKKQQTIIFRYVTEPSCNLQGEL